MSDLAAAAAALGIPETLVERSAAARAAEGGASAEEIIAAWGGGAAVDTTPTPTSAPPSATEPDPAPTAQPQQEPAAPSIVTPPPPPIAAPAPAGPYKPPVLIGATDNPIKVLVGVVGLFVVILFIGLIGPSLQAENPGARTSDLAMSGAAETGQNLYVELGCVACHTQMVRPVVADVGLGGVTLNDTNQVPGTRRFGPDLSDVGNRLGGAELESIVSGDNASHPPHSLSTDDMSALVAYLSESRTAG